MLDVFIYGKVNRVSPEAPVPILLESGERSMPGGAGNVAINLRALGCQTFIAGVVGADRNGQVLHSSLCDQNIDTNLLLTKIEYPTSVKIRYVAGSHHLLRVDKEEMLTDQDAKSHLLRLISQKIPEMDIVLLSDYGKGLFDREMLSSCIAQCKKYGKQVIVDPKRNDYSYYAGATLVKPNLKEFIAAIGHEIHPSQPSFDRQAIQFGRKLCNKHQIDNLLVTLGEYGMIFIPGTEGEALIRMDTQAREVFDVSGAGDTSLAVLGAAIASGAPIRDAMELANIASGIVVSKFGTASVTDKELKEQLNGIQKPRKLSSEQAAQLSQELRAQGKTVGFTNGCFDILHPGHIQSFEKAKKECDILFVGLNSDASVKRLKGSTRPVNNESIRTAMLLGLKAVDYVVVFDDDTALSLVQSIHPDVIAKEGYPLDKWPEGQYVVSYGGRAIELPRIDGFSSTEIIHKLSKSSQERSL